MILSIILSVAVLIAGFFGGLIISWNSRDELESGGIWFKALMIVSALGFIVFVFLGNWEISLSFAFIIVVSGTSLMKSRDSRWIKRRV